MGQTALDSKIATDYAMMVVMKWHNLTARYTSWTSDVTISGVSSDLDGTYDSQPSLLIEMGERHGGVEDKPCRVTMLRDLDPFDEMARGFVHAPVRVWMAHCEPGDASATMRLLHRGWIENLIRNPGGATRLVRAEVVGVKAFLKDVPLGLYTTPHCQWEFASAYCGATQVVANGTIAAVGSPSQNAISVSFGAAPSNDPKLWRRGHVEVNGAKVDITNVTGTNPMTVYLRRVPPSDWDSESVTMRSGCDKTLNVCRDVYSNEINRQAPGESIPDYNPAFATA